MKLIACATALACSATVFASDMTSVLPNAKPGECYAKVVIPAQYRTESSTIVVREESERVSILPAKYIWEDKQVLVSDSHKQIKVVPTTYRTVTEQVVTAPAETKWVTGSVFSSVSANPAVLALAERDGVPVNSAEAGECFAEYFQAPEYESVAQRLMISEATESIKVIPAKYEWVEEEREVSPATQELVEVPATYETFEEKIKVQEARTAWKKGRGALEVIDEISGEVMCLVEIPAVYKTIEKTRMKTPPTTRVVEIPAKYESVRVRKLVAPAEEIRSEVPAKFRDLTVREKINDGHHLWQASTRVADSGLRKTGNVICKKAVPAKMTTVSKRVVDKPATTRTIEIPARYQTKKVRKLISAASKSTVKIPAVTREMNKKVKVKDARFEWQPVLCETNTTASTIRRLQTALTDSGHHSGNVDGIMSDETLKAIEHFQRDNNMATGGLTYEVLNKLGVNPG